jgi:hypothetical protein
LAKREETERTLLTAIAAGLSPAVLADALVAAATELAFADSTSSIRHCRNCLRLAVVCMAGQLSH